MNYQIAHFSFGFIGLSNGQLNCLANSLLLLSVPITRNSADSEREKRDEKLILCKSRLQ